MYIQTYIISTQGRFVSILEGTVLSKQGYLQPMHAYFKSVTSELIYTEIVILTRINTANGVEI